MSSVARRYYDRGRQALDTGGFKSAFLPFHEKRRYLEKISSELATFDENFLRWTGWRP